MATWDTWSRVCHALHEDCGLRTPCGVGPGTAALPWIFLSCSRPLALTVLTPSSVGGRTVQSLAQQQPCVCVCAAAQACWRHVLLRLLLPSTT